MIASQQSPVVQSLRTALSVVFTPFYGLVDSPVAWVKNSATEWPGYWFKARHLAQENEDLKAQILSLKVDLQRLQSLQAENAQLQDLTQSAAYEEKDSLLGRVLAVDTELYHDQIIVDKGQRQGVVVGQSVLDEKGLLGQVIQVASSTSRIQLITDGLSGVPVKVLRNGIRGILMGNGSKDILKLNYIPLAADLKVGDQLVTSGIGGHFPAGYPVAEVTVVVSPPGSLFLEIQAKPVANLKGANFVIFLRGKDA